MYRQMGYEDVGNLMMKQIEMKNGIKMYENRIG